MTNKHTTLVTAVPEQYVFPHVRQKTLDKVREILEKDYNINFYHDDSGDFQYLVDSYDIQILDSLIKIRVGALPHAELVFRLQDNCYQLQGNNYLNLYDTFLDFYEDIEALDILNWKSDKLKDRFEAERFLWAMAISRTEDLLRNIDLSVFRLVSDRVNSKYIG